MSLENVKSFYDLAVKQEEVRSKLNKISSQEAGQTIDVKQAEELAIQFVLPLAAEYGLPFTLEDLHQFNETMKQSSAPGELSAEELEAVAGGVTGGVGWCFIVGLAGLVDVGSFCVFIGS